MHDERQLIADVVVAKHDIERRAKAFAVAHGAVVGDIQTVDLTNDIARLELTPRGPSTLHTGDQNAAILWTESEGFAKRRVLQVLRPDP